MLPILQIGPLALPVPALALLVGLWSGLELAERYASRRGVDPQALYHLILTALLAGIVGARLSYILRYPAEFAASPASLLSFNPGLLDPWGGLAAGLVTALIYSQRKQLPLRATLDAVTPLLAILMLAMAIANLASGAAFGAPANLPWSIELWGTRRHPAQVYELFAAAIILAVIWPGRKQWQSTPSGSLFLTFVSLSAGARLILETFRGDSLFLPGGLRTAQVVAWLILASSLWGLRRLSIEAKAAQVSGPS